ncbi:unnamed protein product [Phaedon cochleariae]|uniref:Double jelly roll-like domain-containing protein n=1 Tax=Phaedon cochleariae TaxID=80249 RepID=A0A9N9SJM5_PHACE|nr:unnamed protein product [Phaedon cochleariae]
MVIGIFIAAAFSLRTYPLRSYNHVTYPKHSSMYRPRRSLPDGVPDDNLRKNGNGRPSLESHESSMVEEPSEPRIQSNQEIRGRMNLKGFNPNEKPYDQKKKVQYTIENLDGGTLEITLNQVSPSEKGFQHLRNSSSRARSRADHVSMCDILGGCRLPEIPDHSDEFIIPRNIDESKDNPVGEDEEEEVHEVDEEKEVHEEARDREEIEEQIESTEETKTPVQELPNGPTTTTTTVEVQIHSVVLKVKHVFPNDEIKPQLMQPIKNDTPILIPFRKWDLSQLPALTNGAKIEIWTVKTSASVERPRYVIVCFQKAKRDIVEADATHFDNTSIVSIRLALNGEYWPNERMQLDFAKQDYNLAYYNYTRFYSSYSHSTEVHPILDYGEFKQHALFVIDCSRQEETMKSSTVDIKLEIEADEGFPADTKAYCIIVHDCLLEYFPLTKVELCNGPTTTTTTTTVEVQIHSVVLKVEHVFPNDDIKLQLMQPIENDIPILIPFRKWDLRQLPALTNGAKSEIWAVKTSASVERPRYVIVCFQKSERDNEEADATHFDNTSIVSITLALNVSQRMDRRVSSNDQGSRSILDEDNPVEHTVSPLEPSISYDLIDLTDGEGGIKSGDVVDRFPSRGGGPLFTSPSGPRTGPQPSP